MRFRLEYDRLVPDPRFLAVNDEGLSRSNLGDLLDSCKIQCDSLDPSNAGARAAISFVEKKSSFLRIYATGQGPLGMLDTTVVPTPRYTLCLAPASVALASVVQRDQQGLAHTKRIQILR